jgi:WD40 repeat protein
MPKQDNVNKALFAQHFDIDPLPPTSTASSDKTVSVWDARAALCVQTFYGHHNSCNACSFNLVGTTVASTDADGVVKLWDVRMVAEIMTINSGKFPANSCEFDRSGQVRIGAGGQAWASTMCVCLGWPCVLFGGAYVVVSAGA